ncbi:hypothetical protein [Phytomonospora endophytica]|uniref:Twin-arginine translocation signal domain-containing protein n=1 Tax=Phytomonospora endophytica TaxID=714109 RepID=A0A841G3V3_9ACTN|nr:hypothetical protein [Phytomonospora endophytica]MBB6038790.1 hypothetical protein [Phytomonospora endophytica]GIG68414.1 hypothetical protein Pen01_47090 [Phytomonospora endophytica]
MSTPDRRHVLRAVAAATAGAVVATTVPASPAAAAEVFTDERVPSLPGWTEAERTDYRHIRAAGFTPEEAVCWLLTARAGGAFFGLPVQHPSEIPEVVTAIHEIQNKLLSRPTYRIYRDQYEGDAMA